jgi:hypothetical protein
VMCYMDDIAGKGECYSEFTGERLAIAEFNQRNEAKKYHHAMILMTSPSSGGSRRS